MFVVLWTVACHVRGGRGVSNHIFCKSSPGRGRAVGASDLIFEPARSAESVTGTVAGGQYRTQWIGADQSWRHPRSLSLSDRGPSLLSVRVSLAKALEHRLGQYCRAVRQVGIRRRGIGVSRCLPVPRGCGAGFPPLCPRVTASPASGNTAARREAPRVPRPLPGSPLQIPTSSAYRSDQAALSESVSSRLSRLAQHLWTAYRGTSFLFRSTLRRSTLLVVQIPSI